ncbi:MAG TPA: hypothetical protein VMV18_00895 [bacterium]|nr:hypothetical protein [bacterium]
MQIVLLVIGVAILWGVAIKAPSLMNQMLLNNIANDEVAKMNISMDDERIRKEVIDQALQQGVHLNPANVNLERQTIPYMENRITITWNEDETTFFGGTASVPHKVKAKVRTGERAPK